MRISKSDYIFNIIEDTLVIEDLNIGGMSVTNDAENVITEIRKNSGKTIENYPIIYKDSDGIWDGLKPVWGLSVCTEVHFIHLGENEMNDAIKKIKEKKQ